MGCAAGRAVHGTGVGIVTTRTPVLDVDCMDQSLSGSFWRGSTDMFGWAPTRFGNAPKIALLFRTDEPFKTVSSSQYIDSEGRRAQLEILGDRHQFVAFAIHPDTKKPYTCRPRVRSTFVRMS